MFLIHAHAIKIFAITKFRTITTDKEAIDNYKKRWTKCLENTIAPLVASHHHCHGGLPHLWGRGGAFLATPENENFMFKT